MPAVERVGFAAHPASYAFTNPWIVENRYKGKVELSRPIRPQRGNNLVGIIGQEFYRG